MKRSNSKTRSAKPAARPRTTVADKRLYEADETAWLEQMADCIQKRQYDRLDYQNLAEYLLDMARRDRREVLHRLTTMLVHLLKSDHQPEMSSRSWELTIRVQRHELRDLCESRTLRNHAEEVLPKAYARARDQAAAETGLPEDRFPPDCPYTIDDLVAEE